MANKKLSYSDIAEPKLFDPLKKEIQEVNKLLGVMSDGLKQTVDESAKLAKQNPLKSYEDIKDINRQLETQKKAVSSLDKIERNRAKLQEKLKDLEEGRLDATIRLRAEIQETTKQLKREAILNSEKVGEYKKQSNLLNKLRQEYKDLALTQGENSEEAKKLLKQIVKLDEKLKDLDETVGQSQRKVGSYEKAVKKLQKQLNRLAAVGGAIAIFDKLGDAIQANRGASDAFQKVIARITITIQVLVSRTVKGFQAFTNVFKKARVDIQIFFLNLKKGFADLPSLIGGSEKKSAELAEQIENLNKESQSLAGSGLKDVFGAYKGVREEIESLIKANDKLIDNTTTQERAVIALTRQNAKLIQQQATLEQQAGDSTLSIRENKKALDELQTVNEQIAANNIKIAAGELSIARQRANIRKDDLEAQKEYATAYANFEQVKADAAVQAADVETESRQRTIDQQEAELDILFDVSDRRKTVLEQQANDERLSLENRSKAIEEANRVIAKSYEQIEGVIGEGIDIDSLLKIDDLQELNKEIDKLDVGEQIRNRIRESLIERLQAVQDLAVAQLDLNDATNEYNEISQDVITQEQILKDIQGGKIEASEVLDALEEKRIENQISRLNKEIALAEKGSTARVKLQQELNEILLDQASKQAEKQAEMEEKAQQKRIDQIEKAKELFGVLGDSIQQSLDNQIDKLDELIDKSQEREDQLRESAERGVQDAEENLALQAQVTEQAERERQKAIQRQKQAELALTALQVYAGKVQAGDKNALTSTITDISLLKSFIDSIPAFYKGSEKVGDDLDPVMPGKDGHLIRVDGQERIMNPTHSAMIPSDMTNYELAKLAQSSRNQGNLSDVSGVEKRLDLVAQKIGQLELYQGMDFDRKKEAITHILKKGNRLERRHSKLGGVFG